MNEIIVSEKLDKELDTELVVVTPSKAQMIKSTFEPMVDKLNKFESRFNEVISAKEIDEDLIKKARRLRLDIKKVRTQTAKIKDEQKAEYIRAGKAIQGVHNIIVYAVQDKEEQLMKIETHFERLEQERIERLQSERVDLLCPYVDDAEDRDLGSMDPDVWDAYLSAKKKAYEDRIEAERIAEEQRIEAERLKAEEEARLKAELEQIRKEKEESDRLARIEREKIEAERKANAEIQRKRDEALRIERENERKKQEAIQAELEAKILEERKKKQAEIDRVNAEKKAIEEKALAEQAKREQALEEERLLKESKLSLEDEDKILDMLSEINAVYESYSYKSEAISKINDNVGKLLSKINTYVNNNIEEVSL